MTHITLQNQIGLSWSAPVFDGGSPIIDYRIWTDDATGTTFTELVSGVQALEYTATSLVRGSTYQFYVEARNIYGYSVASNTVTILAAQIPAQPAAPTTSFAADYITVSWVAPDNGGTEITSYTIYIRESDEQTFSVHLGDCDGTLESIIQSQ
jgi:hypothetical protein